MKRQPTHSQVFFIRQRNPPASGRSDRYASSSHSEAKKAPSVYTRGRWELSIGEFMSGSGGGKHRQARFRAMTACLVPAPLQHRRWQIRYSDHTWFHHQRRSEPPMHSEPALSVTFTPPAPLNQVYSVDAAGKAEVVVG